MLRLSPKPSWHLPTQLPILKCKTLQSSEPALTQLGVHNVCVQHSPGHSAPGLSAIERVVSAVVAARAPIEEPSPLSKGYLPEVHSLEVMLATSTTRVPGVDKTNAVSSGPRAGDYHTSL